MAANDIILNQRGVFPVYSGVDLLTSFTPSPATAPPPFPEGGLAFYEDAFGAYRVYQFRQNKHGSALTQYGLESKKLLTVSLTAGSTTTSLVTSAGISTTGLFTGALVTDATATVAGALPEGQVARIISTPTSSAATLDSNLPFGTTPGATDAMVVISPKIIKAAAGDTAGIVAGVVHVALADGDWGWLQLSGFCPRVVVKDSTAFTATHTIKAGTEVIDTNAAVTVSSITFGYVIAAVSGSQTGGKTTNCVLTLMPGVL